MNPRRRYNNYKHICTQHRSTAYVRQMLTSMKGEINNNTIIVGDFNTPLTPMDRSTNQMSPGREAACRAVFGTWGFFRTMHGKTAPSC